MFLVFIFTNSVESEYSFQAPYLIIMWPMYAEHSFIFSFNLFIFLYVQALAWVSDLMVEHQEIFWSLFTVDMDAALAAQLPDTWESFQLFQLLNEYLCNDSK